jgi:hypothetical protein
MRNDEYKAGKKLRSRIKTLEIISAGRSIQNTLTADQTVLILNAAATLTNNILLMSSSKWEFIVFTQRIC